MNLMRVAHERFESYLLESESYLLESESHLQESESDLLKSESDLLESLQVFSEQSMIRQFKQFITTN
jgi:hypothetical protein